MADPECGAALSPPPPTPVHGKALVVANRTKPPEASRFFLNDVVDLLMSMLMITLIAIGPTLVSRKQSIIIPSVNVSSKIFIG